MDDVSITRPEQHDDITTNSYASSQLTKFTIARPLISLHRKIPNSHNNILPRVELLEVLTEVIRLLLYKHLERSVHWYLQEEFSLNGNAPPGDERCAIYRVLIVPI